MYGTNGKLYHKIDDFTYEVIMEDESIVTATVKDPELSSNLAVGDIVLVSVADHSGELPIIRFKGFSKFLTETGKDKIRNLPIKG